MLSQSSEASQNLMQNVFYLYLFIKIAINEIFGQNQFLRRSFGQIEKILFCCLDLEILKLYFKYLGQDCSCGFEVRDSSDLSCLFFYARKT